MPPLAYTSPPPHSEAGWNGICIIFSCKTLPLTIITGDTAVRPMRITIHSPKGSWSYVTVEEIPEGVLKGFAALDALYRKQAPYTAGHSHYY